MSRPRGSFQKAAVEWMSAKEAYKEAESAKMRAENKMLAEDTCMKKAKESLAEHVGPETLYASTLVEEDGCQKAFVVRHEDGTNEVEGKNIIIAVVEIQS